MTTMQNKPLRQTSLHENLARTLLTRRDNDEQEECPVHRGFFPEGSGLPARTEPRESLLRQVQRRQAALRDVP